MAKELLFDTIVATMIKHATEVFWQTVTPFIRAVLRIVAKWWWVILIIAALVAGSLTLIIGLAQSVWFDEAYSLTVARQSISQLVHLTSIDVHPPLYYLLLKAWNSLFGWNDFSYRLLGAVLGTLIVGASGLLTKKLFGVKAMVIALPLVTLAPFMIRYDFEIRMYALAALLGLIATYILIVALEAKRRQAIWWIVYALLVVISMYTVYYIALLWIAHLVWLLIQARKNRQVVAKQPWVYAYLGAIVVFLPWIPVFIGQITNGALANIAQAMTIENLMGIVSFGFLYQSTGQLGAWGAIVMVALLCVLVWLGISTYKTSNTSERSYLKLLVLYVLVPVGVVTIVSLFRPFYVERYLVPVLIGGYILTGVAVAFAARRTPRKAFVAFMFLIAVSVAGLFNLSAQGNFNFQRWQAPAVKSTAAIIGECQANQAVLAADPYVYIELSQYVSSSCPLYFFEESETLAGGYAPISKSSQQIKNIDQLKSLSTITYVYYDSPKLQPPNGFTITANEYQESLRIQSWQKN